MITNIGIVGLGYVGGSVRHWFRKQKGRYRIFCYDKYKKIGSMEEVNRADIIFVAVPTPFREGKKGYDDSAVWEVIGGIADGKVIVVKSTILPGSSDRFQKKYPKKTFLFNPEFLVAQSAKRDFTHPERQIVGYTNARSRSWAKKVLSILPPAPFSKIVRAKEAEIVKYFGNAFLATRVIFANHIYDLCERLGNADYEVVKECAAQDPRIGGSHFTVFHDGYRGFGGVCLPKDLKSLLQLARSHRVLMPLLETVHDVNKRLLKQKKRRMMS